MSTSHVLNFSAITKDDVAAAGGKGASLGELTRAGIPVPPGFVVTTYAFRESLLNIEQAKDFEGKISKLSGDDIAQVKEVADPIRELVRKSELPKGLVEEISDAYKKLCTLSNVAEVAVAVRSSATSEDSADASFAGQQDTYLWVQGIDDVLNSVRECWSSLYSVDSVSYRRRRNLPEEGLAMAVVVQIMVNSKCSGVMFTRNPVNGDRSVLAIDASWGLGSAIVGGEVTPDSFLVNKITQEVMKRSISQKMHQEIPNKNGKGVKLEEVPTQLQSKPSLSDSELLSLSTIGLQVEKHYNSPQDIEWAVSHTAVGSNEIFILQSRPETVWASKEVKPVAAPAEKAFMHVAAMLSAGFGPKEK
jgi:pyruvate,water dikinase